MTAWLGPAETQGLRVPTLAELVGRGEAAWNQRSWWGGASQTSPARSTYLGQEFGCKTLPLGVFQQLLTPGWLGVCMEPREQALSLPRGLRSRATFLSSPHSDHQGWEDKWDL